MSITLCSYQANYHHEHLTCMWRWLIYSRILHFIPNTTFEYDSVSRNVKIPTDLGECSGHLEGADGVHVGGDDGDTLVHALRVQERELAPDLDIGARLDRAPLRTQQHVLEVQLHLVDHVRHLDGVGSLLQELGPSVR